MHLFNQVPARIVQDVVIELDDRGRPRIVSGSLEAVTEQDFGDDLTIVLNDEGVWHYFHFVETMIWLWIIQHRLLRGARVKRIAFLFPWDNPHQNHVQKAFLKAAFPLAEIHDLQLALPVLIRSALVIDRAWASGSLNKFNEACIDLDVGIIRCMSENVRLAVGAFPMKRDRLRATYVKRHPPRCLDPDVESQILTALERNFELITVDFAHIPWEQQVRLSAATDLMIGVHGNGLTNSLWMQPGGLLIEFFPLKVHHYDYQLMTELAGLSYFGLEGENVYTSFCRVGPPFGHTPEADKPVEKIKVDRMFNLISTWNARNGRAPIATQLAWRL